MAGGSGAGSPPAQNSAPTPQQHPSNPMMGGMPPPGAPGYPGPYGFYPGSMPGMPGIPPPYPPYGSPMPPPRMGDPNKDKEKAEVHVITLHPRGMPRPYDVPFPERRLPVCDKCKKNYKSRDLCRTRDGHKTLPWTTTYVAITIDKSLLVEDDDGKLTYADVPAIGLLMDTPLMCLGPSDGSMKSEPICKVCREKNYTRDYCRNTCKHTTPPWSTTYVKLVEDTRDVGERCMGYGSIKNRTAKRRKKGSVPGDGQDGRIKNTDMTSHVENLGAFEASYEGEEGDVLKSDNLSVIHESRTFLAAVSSKSVIVRWCERIQYPESAENTTLESAFKKLKEEDENHDASSSAAAASGMNANLFNEKLWEAFRAGVMWATSQQGQIPPGAMPQGYGYGMPMQGGMGYFGQPPPPGSGGEMPPGGPWGGPMYGGYGPHMNGPGGATSDQGSGAPQDLDKKSFRNKNPADGEEAVAEEDNNECKMQDYI